MNFLKMWVVLTAVGCIFYVVANTLLQVWFGLESDFIEFIIPLSLSAGLAAILKYPLNYE